jgi:hypothetical protein
VLGNRNFFLGKAHKGGDSGAKGWKGGSKGWIKVLVKLLGSRFVKFGLNTFG